MAATSSQAHQNPAPSTGLHLWRVLGAALGLFGGVVRGLIAFVVLVALTAGLPWALVHFIGWPLPDHVPTWDEIQVTLLSPMSPQFLLDVLACALWPLWARFTFGVLAAIPVAVRAAPWSQPWQGLHRGPLHAVAGVLVGAIVLSILSSRTTTSATTAQAAATAFTEAGHTIVATIPNTSGAGLPAESPVFIAAVHTRSVTAQGEDNETVRTPEHGVHDSLWRVAQRCLGDGNRWPEIWKLNQGVTQTDGRAFTTPSLIQPGWQLRLPNSTPVSVSPADEQPAPTVSPPPPGPGERPQTPAAPPAEHVEPAASAANPPAGISLSTGAFVGLGLAALITAATVTARLRRRRFYRPGTPEPDDAGAGPVVRALRIAHDASAPLHDDGLAAIPALPPDTTKPTDVVTRDRARAAARDLQSELGETVLGVRDGQAVALALAHEHGLGLIGPGAYAAARALIVTQLARAAENGLEVLIVIPAADAQALLGADLPRRTPARLRVVHDLPAALDTLEAELLTRVRDEDFLSIDRQMHASLMLIATSTTDAERRTQAVLDNGSGLGLTGVVLGQWRPGGTARVRADGIIGATSPSLADSLAGARLFTLPEDDATELLKLLKAAESRLEGPAEPKSDEHDPSGTAFEFCAAESDTTEPEVSVEPALPPVRVLIDNPAEDPSVSSSDRASVAPCRAPGEHQADLDSSVTDSVAGRQPSLRSSDSGSRHVSEPEPATLHLQILGRIHLNRLGPEPIDIIESLAPRQREILVYLALHREGSRRETLSAALWPDAPGDRPYNSFHATLSQLRSSLRKATGNAVANIAVNDDGHYGLDRSLLTVDLWQLNDALSARRRATALEAKVRELRRAVALYRGDLAEGIAADWIDGPREALRRELLDALSALIRAVGEEDPEQTLALLEQARGLDPYNEAIYRDLMRTQARLGHYETVPRTLNLLVRSLADLDLRPTRDTVEIASFLRRPRDGRQAG